MDVLSSRVLLRPRNLERSLAFYGDTLGLAVYREYGSGLDRGVVFFLGGGFLELSGSAGDGPPSDGRIGLWIQVRDLKATEAELRANDVPIDQPAMRMPWGLCELLSHDPDGVRLVFVEVPDDHPLRRRLD